MKPNESLEHISNKYKLMKELSIQVDWENPEFEKMWDNHYLNKVLSHESTQELLKTNPSLVKKKFKLAQELKLSDSELESFHANFDIFKDSDNSNIIERINMLRKTKLGETLDPEGITGFHESYDFYKNLSTELSHIGDKEEIVSIGLNGFYKIDTPSNYFKEPGILIEPRKFMLEDLINLKLNITDSSGKTRMEYLKDLDEDGFGRIQEICHIIENLGVHPNAKNHAIEQLINNLGQKYLKNGVASDSIEYMDNITDHPDITEIVDKLSSMFMKLPVNLLENLHTLIGQHEFLTFCSIEPYMISVVGNALFFKILLPLHRQGVFSLLMLQVMTDVGIKKMNAFQYMKHKYMEVHPLLLKHGIPIVSFFLGNEVSIGGQNMIEDDKKPIEEEEKKIPLSKKIRDKEKAQGFTDKEGKEYLSSVREFVYKVGVEAGKSVGVFGRGLKDGVVSENQDDIADIVEAIEKKGQSKPK